MKLLVNIFTQEPLLKILKKLQQLDKLDIEAIYYLQKKFKSLQIDEDLGNFFINFFKINLFF